MKYRSNGRYTREDFEELFRVINVWSWPEKAAGTVDQPFSNLSNVFQSMLKWHSHKQATKYTLEKVMSPQYLVLIMKLIFATRLREVPKHLNDPNIFMRMTASWRLKIAK